MILGFADFEVDTLETAGFGRRSSAFAKNGTYSMEFDGDLSLSTWHNCVSRVANNNAPFVEYRGWGWWALGGWLYVDAVPASGTVSMMMSEIGGTSFPNWAVGMQVSGSAPQLHLFHNKGTKGSYTLGAVGTWYWVCWVMNRHGQVELWVDGTKRIDVASGANAMLNSPLPSYHEVEKDGKTSVGSSWFWDTMFLQDDYGFENADTPLTLNSAGLRVPVLTEAGADKSGCATGVRDWTDITLTSEYLRAVAPKEKVSVQTPFQFKDCDGTTTWEQGSDNAKEGTSIIYGTVLGRRPDGTRWTEANFNELGWGPRIDGVYPLIATVEEGPMDTSPPTRYAGLYPG